VCVLEMEEEGQQGHYECGKNDGKEWEWAEEEERCECVLLIFGRKDIHETID
jgi:hypothetical protein